jgi:hypothetical protein
MCFNDTFTTVVSSTSMQVLDITAMAISHGLMSRATSDWAIWRLAKSPQGRMADVKHRLLIRD